MTSDIKPVEDSKGTYANHKGLPKSRSKINNKRPEADDRTAARAEFLRYASINQTST